MGLSLTRHSVIVVTQTTTILGGALGGSPGGIPAGGVPAGGVPALGGLGRRDLAYEHAMHLFGELEEVYFHDHPDARGSLEKRDNDPYLIKAISSACSCLNIPTLTSTLPASGTAVS